MSLGYQRTLNTNSIPIWQGLDKDIQLLQGGVALAATGLANGSVIPAGTPVVYDEATRIGTIVGGGYLQANATSSAVTYRLVKGHTFKVGDYLSVVAGGTAYAITAIDTSNASYDTVTVGTTLGVGYSAGQVLFASSATGATASAYPAVNGLTYDDKTVDYSYKSLGVVIRGTVYARRIPYTYSAGMAALTGLKNIIFSQSK